MLKIAQGQDFEQSSPYSKQSHLSEMGGQTDLLRLITSEHSNRAGIAAINPRTLRDKCIHPYTCPPQAEWTL